MRNHRRLFGQIILPLILLLPAAAGGQSSDRNFLPGGLLKGPRREFRGLYENKSYDYSVVIPDRLVGYDDANPSYQRGFVIPLRQPPRSYINLFGEVNSLEYKDAIDAAVASLAYLCKNPRKVESATISRTHLGGLDAATVIATYTCLDSGDRYVQSTTMVLSPRRGKLFEITLHTPSDRYESDRPTLEQILKSWKYIGAETAEEGAKETAETSRLLTARGLHR